MNEIMKALIGARVRIISVRGETEAQDIGLLEAYDHPFIRLRKDDGHVLVFPLYRVRLIEPWN